MTTSFAWRKAFAAAQFAFVCALLSSPPGFGQGTTKIGPNETPLMRSQFERWKERGAQIEAHVRAGNFKKAESAANGLLRDLTNKLTGGPDAGRILAMPLSLRALARVGLQREDDGLWDYQMAAVLWPSLAKVRLEDYGATGVRLAQIVAEALREATVRDEAGLSQEASSIAPGTDSLNEAELITPPKALAKEGIDFPASLSIAMKSGQAMIALFIDAEGRPHFPKIHGNSSQNAVFLLAAMDGVRNWRFQPAMFRGKPVAVNYTLTVNYRLRG